jgi:hypothetical protein
MLLCLTALVVGLAPGLSFGASKKAGAGAAEHLHGIFVSNFERAVFFLCARQADGCLPADDNAYALNCAQPVCGELTAAIRANATKMPDQTVWLEVDLVGTRSRRKAKPQYLGDPGRSILVQKVEKVQVVPPLS